MLNITWTSPAEGEAFTAKLQGWGDWDWDSQGGTMDAAYAGHRFLIGEGDSCWYMHYHIWYSMIIWYYIYIYIYYYIIAVVKCIKLQLLAPSYSFLSTVHWEKNCHGFAREISAKLLPIKSLGLRRAKGPEDLMIWCVEVEQKIQVLCQSGLPGYWQVSIFAEPQFCWKSQSHRVYDDFGKMVRLRRQDHNYQLLQK